MTGLKTLPQVVRLFRESGWKDESPEFANALKCFRAALGEFRSNLVNSIAAPILLLGRKLGE